MARIITKICDGRHCQEREKGAEFAARRPVALSESQWNPGDAKQQGVTGGTDASKKYDSRQFNNPEFIVFDGGFRRTRP
jgi:hypothetical protein